MKWMLNLVFLVFTVLSVNAEKARYDNYRVYSIEVDNDLQLRVLKELSETSDSVSDESFL